MRARRWACDEALKNIPACPPPPTMRRAARAAATWWVGEGAWGGRLEFTMPVPAPSQPFSRARPCADLADDPRRAGLHTWPPAAAPRLGGRRRRRRRGRCRRRRARSRRRRRSNCTRHLLALARRARRPGLGSGAAQQAARVRGRVQQAGKGLLVQHVRGLGYGRRCAVDDGAGGIERGRRRVNLREREEWAGMRASAREEGG